MGSRHSRGSNDHSSSSSSSNSSDPHSTYSSSSAYQRTRPDRRPSLEGGGVPGEHLLPLFTIMLEAVRFFLETPGNQKLAQRPRFCPLTRPRLRLLRRRR